jgi:hypothetical protein
MKTTLPIAIRVLLIILLCVGVMLAAVPFYQWIYLSLSEYSASMRISMLFDQNRYFISVLFFALATGLFPIGSAIVWSVIGIKRNDKRLAILGIVFTFLILSVLLRYQMVKIQEGSLEESGMRMFKEIVSNGLQVAADPSSLVLKKMFWLYALGGITVGSVVAWFVMRNKKERVIAVEQVQIDQTTA